MSLCYNNLFQLQSAILLLKGRIYEKLDNRTRAADCFKYALRHDVYCYEAFHALVQHQMLTAAEGLCRSFKVVKIV